MIKFKRISIIIFLIIFGTFLISNINKSKVIKTDLILVKGTINIRKPYCGGAPPPHEEEFGIFYPFANTEFYLVFENDSSRKAQYKIVTDERGCFEIYIKPGTYSLFSKQKMLPFEEFYEINKEVSNSNLMSWGKSCYKKWYNTPDFVFTASRDTFLFVEYGESCYTGMNPCLIYNGPYPP